MNKDKIDRPNRFERKRLASPMRFQDRDGELLFAIQIYDGILARRHIRELFWPLASEQAMERRLSILFHNRYLNWPDIGQRRTRAIPEPIVWLGWKGILHLSAMSGVLVAYPEKENETQLRKLERRLRENGIRWQREPRWSQLTHDLAVIDFRRILEKSVDLSPGLTLESWVPEGEFFADMDVVDFTYLDRDGVERRGRKGVRPDGFFTLLDSRRKAQGFAARARFLFELDNATHMLNKFGRDKLAAGLAYLRSQAYANRFGSNSGRWLIVCTSERRMWNLKSMAETTIGEDARLFYFGVLDQLSPQNLFAQPVWHQGGQEERKFLFR